MSKTVSHLYLGERVLHFSFGEGIVLARDDASGIVEVDFGNGVVKKLMETIADMDVLVKAPERIANEERAKSARKVTDARRAERVRVEAKAEAEMDAARSTEDLDIFPIEGDGPTIEVPPWEAKGRGLAVFQCQATPPFSHVYGLQGTIVVTPTSRRPIIRGDEKRIILKDFPERFFFERDELQALIDGVVLPAYRNRIPLYFFTACSQDFFSAGKLPFGDQEALRDALHHLAREQLAALLAQMCIKFPSPDAIGAAGETPMTPIERMLAKAMTRLGLEFTAQQPVGPYYADFLLKSEGGHLLCVEADGRDFHDADRDRVRDAALCGHHGIAEVLRFSGSAIWHGPILCAQQIQERLLGLDLSLPPDVTILPDPLPDLTPDQAACLTPAEGVVLTLAPAGSGKTRVLTRRVVEAVRAGIRSERVLCVVFNKGAQEVMVQRIHGDRNLPGVVIKTLHAIGYEIAREAPGSPYRSFRIANDESLNGGVKKLFRDALRRDIEEQAQTQDPTGERPGGRPKRTFVPDELVEACDQYVSVFKKTLRAVGEPMEMESVEAFDVKQAARVHQAVDDELFRLGLMTYDDQIYKAVEVLLASPPARAKYQQRFDAVLSTQAYVIRYFDPVLKVPGYLEKVTV